MHNEQHPLEQLHYELVEILSKLQGPYELTNDELLTLCIGCGVSTSEFRSEITA